MRIAVVQFPGSGGAADAVHAYANVLDRDVFTVWHQEEIIDADILVIPGGAAFGDYLRPGSLCKSSPVVGAINKFAKDDKPIIGIGNGFQILCELEILPGALLRNSNSRFLDTEPYMVVENENSVWTRHVDPDELLQLPLTCYFGRYYADKRTLKDLEEEGRVAFRFCDADGDSDPEDPFNGCSHSIAGVLNRHQNVLGIMAHPERAVEQFLGATDGRGILEGPFLGEKVVRDMDDDDDDFDDEDD